MKQTAFEDLQVLSRERESRAGCAEQCQDAAGDRVIRVRIFRPDIQRDVLAHLTSQLPVRLSADALELLLPWRDGQTLEAWLYAAKPGLGQRRDACLSLLADLMVEPAPPVLIALSADAENLRFAPQGVFLRLLPDLENWHRAMGPRDTVQAAAFLMGQLLTQGFSPWERRRFPEELQLILRRCGAQGYTRWDTLQQDLAALPDTLVPPGRVLLRAEARLRRLRERCGPMAVRVTVAALAAAALLSLAGAVQTWYSRRGGMWPGITAVGDQVLRGEEVDAP